MESDNFTDEIRRAWKHDRPGKQKKMQLGRKRLKYCVASLILGLFFLFDALVFFRVGDAFFLAFFILALCLWSFAAYCLGTAGMKHKKPRVCNDGFDVEEMIIERVGEAISSQGYPGLLDRAWEEPETQDGPGPTRVDKLLKSMSPGKISARIKSLGSRSPTERHNARITLCLYTGRDFGEDPAQWRQWHEENRDKDIHELWMDSLCRKSYDLYDRPVDDQVSVILLAMVAEEDKYVRCAAQQLLQHITGRSVAYNYNGSEKLRQWQVKRWKIGYEKEQKLRNKRPRR